MYAAEWPCCHDPLRFSLGSDDLLPRATTLAQPTPASSSPLCAPLCPSSTLVAHLSIYSKHYHPMAKRRPHTAHNHPIALDHPRGLGQKSEIAASFCAHGPSRDSDSPFHARRHLFTHRRTCMCCVHAPVCLRALSGCANSINAPRQSAGRTLHISAHTVALSQASRQSKGLTG